MWHMYYEIFSYFRQLINLVNELTAFLTARLIDSGNVYSICRGIFVIVE